MTTNQTIDGVPRELLENLLHCGDTASTITPFVTARLREILAAEAQPDISQGEHALFDKWLRSRPHVLNVGFDTKTGKYLLQEDEDCWQAWQARAIISAQLQGEPVAVALSADELQFLEVIAMNPGAKLNGGEAFDDEGNSLWGRLEKLGLIDCVGSYKWKLAFNAVELGIKAFVGRPPAPAVLPGNWKSLLLEEMCKRCNLERDEDNHLEGDDTQVGVEFARDWIAERINQVIAEQPAPVAPAKLALPERRELGPDYPYLSDLDIEWNACLDELKRLNPSL